MRGEASRLGTKSSGIQASVNGWDIGMFVSIAHIDGHDVIRAYVTGGSHGSDMKHIGTYKIINGKPNKI